MEILIVGRCLKIFLWSTLHNRSSSTVVSLLNGFIAFRSVLGFTKRDIPICLGISRAQLKPFLPQHERDRMAFIALHMLPLRVIAVFRHFPTHIFFQNAFKVAVTGNTCRSYSFRFLLSCRTLPLQHFAEV